MDADLIVLLVDATRKRLDGETRSIAESLKREGRLHLETY